MKKVISVRFKENGKIYYFDPGDAVIHAGEYVIVETARGVESVSYTHLDVYKRQAGAACAVDDIAVVVAAAHHGGLGETGVDLLADGLT